MMGSQGTSSPRIRLIEIACWMFSWTYLSSCGDDGDAWFEFTPQETLAVSTADFDGDGKTDIATANAKDVHDEFAGRVKVFLQQRGAHFRYRGKSIVGLRPSHLAAGDIDGDSRPDLVSANTDSDDLTILLQDPEEPGTFGTATRIDTAPAPLRVMLRDLDSDGLADLAVLCRDHGLFVFFQESSKPGRFEAALPLASDATFVTSGDIDADGLCDLVVAGNDGVTVLSQDADAERTFITSQIEIANPIPVYLEIADMNADSLQDLIVTEAASADDEATSEIEILVQAPGEQDRFLPWARLMVPAVDKIVAGDVDSDGSTDLLICQSGQISVLFQSHAAPGGFVSAGERIPPRPTLINDFAVGDFNGDGLRDIALAENQFISESLRVYFQDPSARGTFPRRRVLQD